MEKLQCPIYNATLETLYDTKCGGQHSFYDSKIIYHVLNAFTKSLIYYIYTGVHIYIKLKFLFIRLFICPTLTHEPLGRFASNFDLGTR